MLLIEFLIYYYYHKEFSGWTISGKSVVHVYRDHGEQLDREIDGFKSRAR